MTWKEQLVARILLLIARLVCDDPALSQDLKTLSMHIQVNAPKPELERVA